MILFFSNIGSRDILWNEQIINPARTEGEKLLKSVQKFKPEICFPILEPAVEYVFDHSTDRIDQMVLFVTDQADEKFRASDTINFGKIIKRILPEKFKSKITKISLQVIQDEINYYDAMFNFYQDYFKKISCPDADKVFVLATGGIPACNMGLLFHSIDRYQDSVVSLYVNEKTKKTVKIFMGQQLFRHYSKKTILNYLDSYDYSAISALKNINKNVTVLAQAAEFRLNFNFEDALQSLHNYRMQTGDTALQQIKLHLEDLLNGDKQALIAELLYNIHVKIQRKAYVDVLGRLFRLEEAILRYTVEEYLEISTEYKKNREFKDFEEGIQKIAGLKDHLQTSKLGGKRLKFSEPSRETLRAMIGFLHKSKPASTQYQQIAEICIRLKPFSELRNQSILAHGFKGVSKREFKELNAEKLLEEICNIFGSPVRKIGFERINEKIKQIVIEE